MPTESLDGLELSCRDLQRHRRSLTIPLPLIVCFLTPLLHLAAQPTGRANEELALRARRAAATLAGHQHAPGYWLTSYSDGLPMTRPGVELNTFLTSVMVDMLDPIAEAAGLSGNVARARRYLASQIEDGGLVRYHGRPDAPTIKGLGCVITPDADDTALVWRIAPGPRRELLPMALATLEQYRTPDGLYRTWLAPRDRFQCIDAGKQDPNPPDIAIQIHVLMLLARANPEAGRALCRALEQSIGDDRIWVYYKATAMIPILRLADLRKAGCSVQLPPARMKTPVSGQDIWIQAAQVFDAASKAGRPSAGRPSRPTPEVLDLLQKFSRDDFALLRRDPPLLYHNDFSASLKRFYWSWDYGYALWLRIYFGNVAVENTSNGSVGKK